VAEQAASDAVEGTTTGTVDTGTELHGLTSTGADSSGRFPHPEHHGRPMSWVAVSVITIGFIVGGVGMVPHPRWWLFWTGAGIVVVGCIVTAAARTLQVDWY
jgi:hypothetical protein